MLPPPINIFTYTILICHDFIRYINEYGICDTALRISGKGCRKKVDSGFPFILKIIILAPKNYRLMKRENIVNQIKEIVHRIAPTARTILYGSEARGDAR